MTTKNQLRLAWSVAGVLAILLIISLFVILNPKKDLGTVLQEGSDQIVTQREQIRASCAGTTPKERAACQAALTELSSILKEFSKELGDAAPAR